MKKLNTVLNIIMGSCIGVFIGMSVYQCYDYHAHPGLYELTSAPWYTNILVHGVVTVIVLVICAIIKVIIKLRKRK